MFPRRSRSSSGVGISMKELYRTTGTYHSTDWHCILVQDEDKYRWQWTNGVQGEWMDAMELVRRSFNDRNYPHRSDAAEEIYDFTLKHFPDLAAVMVLENL